MPYQFVLQAMYGYLHTGAAQMTGFTPPQMLHNYTTYQQQYFNTNIHSPPAKRQTPNERNYEGQESQQEYPHIVNS